jgi:hypothetical protein
VITQKFRLPASFEETTQLLWPLKSDTAKFSAGSTMK